MYDNRINPTLDERIHKALNVARDILSATTPVSLSATTGAISELGNCAAMARSEGQDSLIPHLQETAQRLEKTLSQ
jgi:hypothetical protein